jgi:bifunctional DNase/RNase
MSAAEPAAADDAGEGLRADDYEDTTLPEGVSVGEVPAEAEVPVEAEVLTEEAVPVEAAEEPLGLELPPVMSLMDFVDVALTLPSTHPVVVLQEKDMPYRELRIPVGGPEGIAIGYAARQIDTPRPLTHELMVKVLEQFNLTLEMVRITDVKGTIFMAELVVSGATGTRTIDCRPSDAIALALRHKLFVPILADPGVLDRAAGPAGGAN